MTSSNLLGSTLVVVRPMARITKDIKDGKYSAFRQIYFSYL
jgi:hypothetical protein